MPDYSFLKMLHMTAAILVAAGILLNTLTILNPSPAPRVAAMRRWDLFVTAPALVALWTLGVILAVQGHWFASGWLPLKLIFVLALSALHGMQAGGLRRLERAQPVPAFLRFSPLFLIGCLGGILLLVETKPF